MINPSRILLLTLLTIDAYIFFSGTKEDYDRLIVFSHISPFIHNSNEQAPLFGWYSRDAFFSASHAWDTNAVKKSSDYYM